MPDYSRITVFILTPLIFRYHLPLKLFSKTKQITKIVRPVLGKLCNEYCTLKSNSVPVYETTVCGSNPVCPRLWNSKERMEDHRLYVQSNLLYLI
jgi:hypothetical protein